MVKSLDQFGQLGDNDTMVNHKGDVPMSQNDDDNGGDEDDYGPKLPSGVVTSRGPLSGPTVPNLQDLDLRRGTSSFGQFLYHFLPANNFKQNKLSQMLKQLAQKLASNTKKKLHPTKPISAPLKTRSPLAPSPEPTNAKWRRSGKKQPQPVNSHLADEAVRQQWMPRPTQS